MHPKEEILIKVMDSGEVTTNEYKTNFTFENEKVEKAVSLLLTKNKIYFRSKEIRNILWTD